ncbi:hypothetical protein D3C73_930870 [compost metagenome]
MHQVDPRTETVVFAKALAQVQMPADLAIGAVIEGHAAGRYIVGALGLQVDATADPAAAGGDAVDEGVRALEQVDPLQRFNGNDLSRQDTVQAVVGNVVGHQRQAANHEHLGKVAEAGGLAHRGIIEQHVTDGLGLLVGDGLGGVAGDAERQVLQRLVAEDTDLRHFGHLTAAVGVGVIIAHGVDVGGAQFQRTIGRHTRRHGVTVAAGADQFKAAAFEQCRETRLCAVGSLQTGTLAVTQLCRVERQGDADRYGKLRQGLAEQARCDVDTAGGIFADAVGGLGGDGQQSGKGQCDAQAQGLERKFGGAVLKRGSHSAFLSSAWN